MKKALQVAGAILAVLFLIGTIEKRRGATSSTAVPASTPIPLKSKEEPPGPREYPLTMAGQLDRCHDTIRDRTFGGADISERTAWDEHLKDVPRLLEIVDATGSNVDPRTFLRIALTAQREVEADGGLTYEMLKKNAGRYAGRSWFLLNAKVLEIFERDGVSIARIEMEPGRHPIAVAWRYLTNFVAGDRVDVVGFWAGDFHYKARIGDVTIPGLAAAGVFKPGTINALNRIQKVWDGSIPQTQISHVARKL